MTPFDAARALLPAWVIWSPLAGAAAAAALSALVGAAAVGWARRRIARIAPEAHWSERARQVHPVRRAAALLVLLVPAACAALAVGGPISRPSIGVALVRQTLLDAGWHRDCQQIFAKAKGELPPPEGDESLASAPSRS